MKLRSWIEFGEFRDEALHLAERPIEIIIGNQLVAPVQGCRGVTPRAEHLAFGHEARFDQVIEHDRGPRARRRQVNMRREARRRLEQPRQHGRLRHVDLARRLAEVILRRRVDAERASAEIGAVEIQLQNVLLGKPRLQPQREKCLLHFAFNRALVVQKQVFRQLLRDRRAALHHVLRAHVGGERAQRAGEIDPEMLVKAPVFGGQHRLDEMVGQLVEPHRVVVPDAALAEYVAVAVEKNDRELALLQPVLVGGLAERGHRQRQHHDRAGGTERHALRGRLDAEPLQAGDVEAVHEAGPVLPLGAQIDLGREQRVADARVEIEKQARQPADAGLGQREFFFRIGFVGHG